MQTKLVRQCCCQRFTKPGRRSVLRSQRRPSHINSDGDQKTRQEDSFVGWLSANGEGSPKGHHQYYAIMCNNMLSNMFVMNGCCARLTRHQVISDVSLQKQLFMCTDIHKKFVSHTLPVTVCPGPGCTFFSTNISEVRIQSNQASMKRCCECVFSRY